MQYVLYVTESGFKAYKKLKSPEEQVEKFAWDDIAQIDLFLSNLTVKSEVLLVLDLIDEDLFFEWVPKVMPWEKKALLNRRKERLKGENVALSEVHSTKQIRKSAEGRSEELILSATISDTFKLSRFLNKLESAQVLIQGIYSKPFLIKEYFQRVVKPSLRLSREKESLPFLIISRHAERDYRQTFFHGGEMRLSRPVQIESDFQTPDEIQTALLEETKLALTYVYNQKIVPFNSPIGLIFLDQDKDVLEGVEQRCLEKGIIRPGWEADEYYFVSTTFRDLGLQGQYCNDVAHCYSEQAIVDFLFSTPLKGFYSTPYIERLQTFQLASKAFYGINLALFLGGLAFILVNSVDNYLSWQKLDMLDQNIAAHQKEKQRLTELVKLQDDAQQIKASVEFSEKVLSLRVGRLVGFNIQELSETLKRHPNIQLNQIDWQTVQELDSKRHKVVMEGWVYPFYETYKKPVYWVDALVKDLEQLKSVESISLDKEPLNRNLKQATKINTDRGELEALPFSITLRVKDGESK